MCPASAFGQLAMTAPACASTASNAWSIGLTLTGASITPLAPCCRPSEGHCEDILRRGVVSHRLIKLLPRAPDLASQRERPPELDTYDEPRLRAPACGEHHAQAAVEAEPGVPEAFQSARRPASSQPPSPDRMAAQHDHPGRKEGEHAQPP